ncbi:hypothetical protein M272_03410 [Vibrio natriegens NBRC 15636 = ATCC 14048 = DSM 759]|jgi:hypothetical protein|nr:hypothetical protein PN96_00200 [Vibrio natriegens NBRC 15636 = ATCC 14048 = DSM 759]ANQ18273.1 hypothetical protein BA891_14200 [Vibrio natriegens]EPM40436.1 hypothetical protein M272_03410 [Vibrio natriegens NBRC 15636 = ATCC 14048 = DSM 759]
MTSISRKDPIYPRKIGRIVLYLRKVFVVCSVESFFAKNACANFLTPYTAHPPTRSETKVTQRVGNERKKKFEKMLDSLTVRSKIRTPNDEQLSCWVS